MSQKKWADYALVIDARCPREFAEDHVPGATNLPVLNDAQYAVVGTTHKDDKFEAYRIGVAWAHENIARVLGDKQGVFSGLTRHEPILVYCFRGGKRSKLWVDALTTCGMNVEKLQGGWKQYRREVNIALDKLPKQFAFRVLAGATGVGKTRLLQALATRGHQVLDLEGLADHRGSLIGSLPGIAQPTQKMFDSRVTDQLRQFDATRPVWVEAESKKIGNVQLSPAMVQSIHAGRAFFVEAEMSVREDVWLQDFGYFAQNPQQLIDLLRPLLPLIGGVVFDRWIALASANDIRGLFRALMVDHYDVCYDRSLQRNYPAGGVRVSLGGISALQVNTCVDELLQCSASMSA